MKNRWCESEAAACGDDPLALRVYSSRLLGREPSLVLHGGGNTSIKAPATNLFGETEEILYVKGSGWDLATIERAGFAPVRLEVLKKMAQLDALSDAEMVKAQRAAMLDPAAPNPSVEAILHAIIPFAVVDHTHADAVVTISNSADGEARLREIYGERVLILPYVMPGFVLAKQVYAATRDIDWSQFDGIILMHHGLFTFANDARDSYAQMIALVDRAERYLAEHAAPTIANRAEANAPPLDLQQLAALRRAVSKLRGAPVLVRLNDSPAARAFSERADVSDITGRGPLTPDHVIRTKRTPMVISAEPRAAVAQFGQAYRNYFQRHAAASEQPLTCLDAAPRWAIWLGTGALAFDRTVAACRIIDDISRHTMQAIAAAESLGGWQVLPEQDIFDLEYWELEQAKLKKGGSTKPFTGKIALVTGAASGIGRACVEALLAEGAAVAALDIDPAVQTQFDSEQLLPLVVDVTDHAALRQAVAATVRHFGGLDTLISNAGIFPPSATIEAMDEARWAQSMALNLTSHQQLLQAAIPYLKQGIDPAVVIIASKNVPAPGPGAAAYSVAKAGLTQLARVAALELSGDGIRVNVLHPNAVFDTAIWTDEVLQKRAASYGLSVAEYKTNNLLGCEVTSKQVAKLACAMAGDLFACTTGAQLPVDGGNERVV